MKLYRSPRKTRALSGLFGLGVVVLGAAGGCSGGFPNQPSTLRLAVTITQPANLGDNLHRRPIVTDPGKPETFTVSVEALKLDGTRDTAFTGGVRLSVKPGSVLEVSGPFTTGRSAFLQAGLAEGIQVPLYNAFGDARIVAEDLGYVPVEPPTRQPPPACSDGIDNDGDGRIDFPADEGCAFANDDSETGGTFAAGASQIIYYRLPRVADVRGAVCTGFEATDPAPQTPICAGGAATPFKAQQVSLDTGYQRDTRKFDFDMVVTRVAANGFYVQDVENDREVAEDPCAVPPVRRKKRGYAGLFAFNFSSPPGMRVCDRIRTLAGTATEFFGSIQIGYPTWTLEEWDAKARPCGEPDPFDLVADDLANQSTLLQNVHSLVRLRSTVIDRPDVDGNGNQICIDDPANVGKKIRSVTKHTLEVRVTKHFGAENPKPNPSFDQTDPSSPQFLITDNASNCDFNGDGSVDFSANPEKGCAASCDLDVECTEWSNFASRSNFYVVLQDSFETKDKPPKPTTVSRKIQADGSTSPGFSPLPFKGKVLGAIQGTLTFFSGGNQFTIEARCVDDLVTDPNAKQKPFAESCVFPRSEGELDPQ
jgi:hypothetical protein